MRCPGAVLQAACSSASWHAKQPEEGNATGRVDRTLEHLRVGHHAHPAVTDSSMHLSLFLGGPDGETRVPGVPTL